MYMCSSNLVEYDALYLPRVRPLPPAVHGERPLVQCHNISRDGLREDKLHLPHARHSLLGALQVDEKLPSVLLLILHKSS